MPSGLPNLNYLMKKGSFELQQYGLKKRGLVQKINKDGSLVYYRVETSKGMNGCPLFYGESLIGIHMGGDEERQLNGGRIFD